MKITVELTKVAVRNYIEKYLENHEGADGVEGWFLQEVFSDCSEIMMNHGKWFIEDQPLDEFKLYTLEDVK